MTLKSVGLAAALVCASAACFPAHSAPADYRAAQNAFYSGDSKQRYETPILLIATGFYAGMSTGEFGPRIFRAIEDFQGSIGADRTGALTTDQLARLRAAGYGAISQWGLAEVAHPYAIAKLFVPRKLAPSQQTTRRGYAFESYDQTFSVDFSSFLYSETSLEELYLRMSSNSGGRHVDYKVLRPAFFAISSGVGRRSSYTRYQQVRSGIVGFTATWDVDRVDHGERVAVMMSNMFYAPLTSEDVTTQVAAVAPPTQIIITPPASPVVAAAPAAPAPPPPAAEAPKPESATESSLGTGFFVTSKRMLTNAHVVKGCDAVSVVFPDAKAAGKVIARDERNDLALVESEKESGSIAELRAGVRLGEDVAAFGYPLNGLLATSGNFTRGNVTATAGIGDDTAALQISAPVQPGNSGGPLVDENGNVVGVVRAKLDAIVALVVAKDLTQNVNFAIKTSVAQTFLETNNTEFTTGTAKDPMKPADLAAKAQAFSAKIECTK